MGRGPGAALEETTLVNPAPGNIEIPGYSVLEELGRGGMATVYLARQERLARNVALKVLCLTGTGEAEHEFVQRFVREARTASRLTHPNIVTIHDFGQHGQVLYMAMEYASGGTLRQHLREHGDPARAAELILRIARALQYLHEHGIVHRDVKPANILFREDGTPVLSDFGIVRAVDETRFTDTGLVVGTPNYLSAEQVRGEQAEPSSDYFSLGVILFELLTGTKPFSGLNRDVATVPRLPHELSRLQPVIDRLLVSDPRQRFQNADQIAQALAEATAGRGARSGWLRGAGLVGGAVAVTLVAVLVIVPRMGGNRTEGGPPPAPPPPAAMTDLAPDIRDLLDSVVMLREAGRLYAPISSNALAVLCRVVQRAPAHPGVGAYLDDLVYRIAAVAPGSTLREYEIVGLRADTRPCLESELDADRKQALRRVQGELEGGQS